MLKKPKTKPVKTKKLKCKTTFWKLKKYISNKNITIHEILNVKN